MMSWSFRLKNGDLALGSASYSTVTGEQKLVQDLRCFILERMGTDDMHPGYGSLIDGGRHPDGTEVGGVIGMANDELAVMEIEAEIKRIVGLYQGQQLQRAKDDRFTYGKATLSKGEVLLGVSDMDFYREMDTLTITLTLSTGDGASPTLELTF